MESSAGARVFAPAYWQEEDDERGGKWAGPASLLGQVGGLPGEREVVLLSLSISIFIYLFCSVLF